MSSLLKSTRNTRAILEDSFRYIRSDVPSEITEEEIQWLLQNNITTVIDLRTLQESSQKPCPLSVRPEFHYMNIPVTGGNAIPGDPSYVSRSYLNMVDNRMIEIIQAIEHAPTNVLYFCNAGKDRTGVVSALLLLRMGKDEGEIITDYMVSGDNLREILFAFASANPQVDINVITPHESYIREFLIAIKNNDIVKLR